MNGAQVVILSGGVSTEREVSLRSGRCAREALGGRMPVRLIELDAARLPAELNPDEVVVLPLLHGTWGEDGGVQDALELGGFEFAGCDAASSRRCFDKVETKELAAAAGVPVLPQRVGLAVELGSPERLVSELGDDIVLKPVCEGSSVGLHLARGRREIAAALENLGAGRWMAEPRIRGRELSVGVLDGEALAVVEIRPRSGVYDYASKYTAGATEYLVPAPLDPAVTAAVRTAAERTFAACGARDFARVDFMLSADHDPFLLEINTLPGLTATSLLPKSAAACGIDFACLVERMTRPAAARLGARLSLFTT